MKHLLTMRPMTMKALIQTSALFATTGARDAACNIPPNRNLYERWKRKGSGNVSIRKVIGCPLLYNSW
jgi:hypothetical protein